MRLIRAGSHKVTLARSSARAPVVSCAREATPENYCSPYTFVRTAELGPSRINLCPLDTEKERQTRNRMTRKTENRVEENGVGKEDMIF